ncbi:fimbrial assembly family protein [Neobacillus bataviensis LMG 21833]|uniref:Fimbrial assembly family protein n=1 Tax=Neobacillus bataviensis LMG 21833 TaxID=1117379 RepID=K6C3Y4_9BACI|nr:PilN domain-containing protein [Neobacillus bataviensis]EKN65860.1 fimbrial assembly family protein [Neobacillus bataviensis LMG 21833]
MLVEINLLPQKKPKKLSFIISLSSIVVVMILVGAYYLWQINATKSEVASLDRQIAMTKKIAQKEEQNSQTVDSSNSVSQLKNAIEWANEYPIQTIPVMRQLTSLLPERGFIQSFGYTEEGTITLSVQFDSAREAAYFLENLNESEWIEDVSLSSLAAAADPADVTVATTTQTNTTGTTNTTNQTETTNSNQSTTGQDTNGATVDAGNQTNTAAGVTTGQNNSVNPATNTNTVNNTSTTTTTSSTTVKKNTNILPRYTGQFEIKLNKDFAKENIQMGKKDEKGVKGS